MRGKTEGRTPCNGNALVEFLHDFPVRGVVWAVEDYDCEFLCDTRCQCFLRQGSFMASVDFFLL